MKILKRTLNKHERNKRHIIPKQRWINYIFVQNKNKLFLANQVLYVRQNNVSDNRLHALSLLKVTLHLAKHG